MHRNLRIGACIKNRQLARTASLLLFRGKNLFCTSHVSSKGKIPSARVTSWDSILIILQREVSLLYESLLFRGKIPSVRVITLQRQESRLYESLLFIENNPSCTSHTHQNNFKWPVIIYENSIYTYMVVNQLLDVERLNRKHC